MLKRLDAETFMTIISGKINDEDSCNGITGDTVITNGVCHTHKLPWIWWSSPCSGKPHIIRESSLLIHYFTLHKNLRTSGLGWVLGLGIVKQIGKWNSPAGQRTSRLAQGFSAHDFLPKILIIVSWHSSLYGFTSWKIWLPKPSRKFNIIALSFPSWY